MNTTQNVGEMDMLSRKLKTVRFCLQFNCVRYLGRQGLALRGDFKEEKGEIDSMQLLLLIAVYNPLILKWLKRSQTGLLAQRYKMK